MTEPKRKRIIFILLGLILSTHGENTNGNQRQSTSPSTSQKDQPKSSRTPFQLLWNSADPQQQRPGNSPSFGQNGFQDSQPNINPLFTSLGGPQFGQNFPMNDFRQQPMWPGSFGQTNNFNGIAGVPGNQGFGSAFANPSQLGIGNGQFPNNLNSGFPNNMNGGFNAGAFPSGVASNPFQGNGQAIPGQFGSFGSSPFINVSYQGPFNNFNRPSTNPSNPFNGGQNNQFVSNNNFGQNQPGSQAQNPFGQNLLGTQGQNPFVQNQPGSQNPFGQNQLNTQDQNPFGQNQFGSQGQSPFGQNQIGIQGQNPFGQNQLGSQGQNAFGQNQFGTQGQNPFGQNQFGSQGQNPFGQNQLGSQGQNAFGQNQFGTQGQNPFGQNQLGSQGQNPFGQNQLGTQGQNPFGQNQLGTQGPNPFGQNQLGSQGQNPFGQNQLGNQGQNPFGQNQLGIQTQNPFGQNQFASQAQSPFGQNQFGPQGQNQPGQNQPMNQQNPFGSQFGNPFGQNQFGAQQFPGVGQFPNQQSQPGLMPGFNQAFNPAFGQQQNPFGPMMSPFTQFGANPYMNQFGFPSGMMQDPLRHANGSSPQLTKQDFLNTPPFLANPFADGAFRNPQILSNSIVPNEQPKQLNKSAPTDDQLKKDTRRFRAYGQFSPEENFLQNAAAGQLPWVNVGGGQFGQTPDAFSQRFGQYGDNSRPLGFTTSYPQVQVPAPTLGTTTSLPAAPQKINDIRELVPGTPGVDYPVYHKVPETGFSCEGKPYGYYADIKSRCQAFHICIVDGAGQIIKNSFLCANGTLFNEGLSVCQWWADVPCRESAEPGSQPFSASASDLKPESSTLRSTYTAETPNRQESGETSVQDNKRPLHLRQLLTPPDMRKILRSQ